MRALIAWLALLAVCAAIPTLVLDIYDASAPATVAPTNHQIEVP